MEEEDYEPIQKYKSIPVCKCLRDSESSEIIQISARKTQILSTVSRTETYLKDRRIPELIRFLLTKLISDVSDKPVAYLEKLLDDCMLFRAGLGIPPVLYEKKHLQAVVKSFDPGNRGWLSAGQVRRVFITLSLPPQKMLEEKTPTEVVINELEKIQEKELYNLLTAGTKEENVTASETSSFAI